MDSNGWITTITLVLSVTSVVLTGLFSIRTQRLSHQLEEEREARLEEQSAIKAAERVYEPLAQAAAELQSRIFNIVESGWLGVQHRYASHGDYAATSTAYLFAQYFGWIEARRQAVLTSSGEGGRDLSVQRVIDGVLAVLRRSEGSEGFLFFTTEQRAIGELMLTWEVHTETGVRIPHVMGYAAFTERFATDAGFSPWFAPVTTGLDLIAKGDNSRLVSIQHALVRLIDELDPKRKYTAGYDLQPIDLGDAPANRA
ncbi:MAG TPA: hypothetical protein VGO65_02915 [Pseudolysinimonas sp.]|jgi:hypothetical protein|nr:hypothetical protein [Pseudolysinimonas sp.]